MAIPVWRVRSDALLPRLPLSSLSPQQAASTENPARLACLIHAANVRSEPGSNPSIVSMTKTIHRNPASQADRSPPAGRTRERMSKKSHDRSARRSEDHPQVATQFDEGNLTPRDEKTDAGPRVAATPTSQEEPDPECSIKVLRQLKLDKSSQTKLSKRDRRFATISPKGEPRSQAGRTV